MKTFTHIKSAAACVVALLGTAVVHAEPYVPDNDAVVLTRMPALEATRALAPLRDAVRHDPNDEANAVQLARAYIDLARRTSDPRFISYAQATLVPWLNRAQPSATVWVLQATTLQNLHRFDAALELLDRALKIEPANAQAWLTKATLLQVQGKFDEAGLACRRLVRSADQLIALTCLTTVDSLSGRLAASYDALLRVAADSNAHGEMSSWVQGQLAEMAVRLGKLSTAERHFIAALRDSPDDVYLQAAYADVLLRQGRQSEVIRRLEDRVAHDALLLRLAIAAHRERSARADDWSAMFDARRRAARADDNSHLREHARFMLEVLERPREALELARANWQLQREPADVQIYVNAARATGSASDERVVREWMRRTGYEDRALGDTTLAVAR